MTRDVRPKCMIRGCRKRATRWDGGFFSVSLKEDGAYTPNPIVWLCAEHDPHHKHFDLPQTLPSAIRDLKALRATFQEYVKKTYFVDQKKLRVKATVETLHKLVDTLPSTIQDLKDLSETFQEYVKKSFPVDHSVDQQKMRTIAETLIKLTDSAKRQLPDADGVDWEIINEAEALAEALCPSLFHQGDGQLPRSK